MNRRLFLNLAAAIGLLGAGSGVALADNTILTVNDVASGKTWEFSDADLAALPQQSFETSTIWTDDVHTFSGPTLRSLLDATGSTTSALQIHAINNYNVEFPAEKIAEDSPVLATRIDGESFSVREKGPLWVVFPYDQNPDFQSEEIFALSVWQVNRIDILTP